MANSTRERIFAEGQQSALHAELHGMPATTGSALSSLDYLRLGWLKLKIEATIHLDACDQFESARQAKRLAYVRWLHDTGQIGEFAVPGFGDTWAILPLEPA